MLMGEWLIDESLLNEAEVAGEQVVALEVDALDDIVFQFHAYLKFSNSIDTTVSLGGITGIVSVDECVGVIFALYFLYLVHGGIVKADFPFLGVQPWSTSVFSTLRTDTLH